MFIGEARGREEAALEDDEEERPFESEGSSGTLVVSELRAPPCYRLLVFDLKLLNIVKQKSALTASRSR